MISPTPEELVQVRDGARISGMLPYLEDYVERQIHIVEMRVFDQSDKGTLTPDGAVSAWMEVKALRRMVRSMKQKGRVGVSIGERVMPKTLEETSNGDQ